MKVISKSLMAAVFCTAVAVSGSAQAAPIWASLTSDNGITNNAAGQVNGTVGGISFAATGDYAFDQLNGSGTNYYGAVPNSGPDIIALSDAGTETITFSAPVSNVYLSLVSFNGASVTTSSPFTVVSNNCSYWGCGTIDQTTPTSFTGTNEAAGVIEFSGTFNSLTFSDTNPEYWHGFNVGIDSAATSAVPEPGTWAMMLVGFGLIGMATRLRRRQNVRVTYA